MVDAGIVQAEQQHRARKALLIANNQGLQGPHHDAAGMERALAKLNFTTTKHLDLSAHQIMEAVKQFRATINDGDVVLFYYSGHGFERQREMHLCGMDHDAVSVDVKVVEVLGQKSNIILIVIVDACRSEQANTTFKQEGSPGEKRPLMLQLIRLNPSARKPISTNNDYVLCYSCDPGTPAFEYLGEGVYTKALLNHIQKPKLIYEMLTDVNKEARARRKSQRPWLLSTLPEGFALSYSCAPVMSAPMHSSLQAGVHERPHNRPIVIATRPRFFHNPGDYTDGSDHPYEQYVRPQEVRHPYQFLNKTLMPYTEESYFPQSG